MPRKTHKIRHTLLGLALAAAVAAFAAPAATAGGSSSDTYKDGWYGYAVALTQQQQRRSSNRCSTAGRPTRVTRPRSPR